MAGKISKPKPPVQAASGEAVIHLPVKQGNPPDLPNPAPILFGAILKESRKRAGLSQADLGRMLGVSRATVVNWEADKYKPEHALLPRVCSILGVTLEQLFGMDVNAGRNAAENRILVNFRQLSRMGQNVVDRMIFTMLEEEQAAKDRQLKESFRVFVQFPGAVAAGAGFDFVDEKPSPVFLRKSDQNERADAIVRVQGDSMEPVYHSGDYVYFRLADSAYSGEDVVCATADGAVIKRMDNDRTLYSVNPDVPFGPKGEDDHVTILGVVTGVVSSSDRAAEEDNGILAELFSEELRDFGTEYGMEDWT